MHCTYTHCSDHKPSSCECGERTKALLVSHRLFQSQIGVSESDRAVVVERIARILKVKEGIPANTAQAEADVEVELTIEELWDEDNRARAAEAEAAKGN